MQRFVVPFLALFMFAGKSYADTSKDLSADLIDSLATAIVMQDIQDGHIVVREDQNFFDQIRDFIAESKDFILETYDFNGNGRIDTIAEFEAVIDFAQTIVTALVDTNYNGVIEPEEVKALVGELLGSVKSQLTDFACQGINKEAQKAGRWLFLRPVLQTLYKQCQKN